MGLGYQGGVYGWRIERGQMRRGWLPAPCRLGQLAATFADRHGRQQVGRNSKAYCAKVNHAHDISLQSYLLDQQGIVISSQQINAKK